MDSNNPDSQDIGGKAVADIKKDFIAMGNHRVHGWYAWAIVGIVVGMAWGIVYVSSWSNHSATFDASQAAGAPTVACMPMKSPFSFAGADDAFLWIHGSPGQEEPDWTDQDADGNPKYVYVGGISSEQATKLIYHDDGTVILPPVYHEQFGYLTKEDGSAPHAADHAINSLAATKKEAVDKCENKLNESLSAASGQCNIQKPTCEAGSNKAAMCVYSISPESNQCGEATCEIASREPLPGPVSGSMDTTRGATQWGIECKSSAPLKYVSCACNGQNRPISVPVQKTVNGTTLNGVSVPANAGNEKDFTPATPATPGADGNTTGVR